MIREVSSIPQPRGAKASTYREMLRADIIEALNRRISKFEFEGDYNYKTLGMYAREVAQTVFFEKIYSPVVADIKKTLMEEYKTENILIPIGWDTAKYIIKISGVTGTDRIHVYGSIDFELLDTFRDRLLSATRLVNSRRHIE